MSCYHINLFGHTSFLVNRTRAVTGNVAWMFKWLSLRLRNQSVDI